MEIEALFKALSHRNRLRIINLLHESELCVCELKHIMETTQSNVSRHLGKLKNTGLITFRRDAQWIYYSIDDEFVSSHPFMEMVLNDELDEGIFEEDDEKLKCYLNSDLDCSDLREGNCIDF
ncbi:ArsR/SmtB family transcription factor [Halarsenatibacter silvermanii]|uniref:Transcriptional regulator, ArsR family n=1 Tax=Halarsenatibacter silvermanii TaxID=321763 RepID=A0A1G9P7X7_9FIRM|nr:metalloregulator ArsR/SmtB family transcription factor [Halarsenatibacter silvermanii]SDL94275.1 transcriptional regulator, ArsR family [Halarsenatibacter silvermanii]